MPHVSVRQAALGVILAPVDADVEGAAWVKSIYLQRSLPALPQAMADRELSPAVFRSPGHVNLTSGCGAVKRLQATGSIAITMGLSSISKDSLMDSTNKPAADHATLPHVSFC
jgi:hypothetical protein